MNQRDAAQFGQIDNAAANNKGGMTLARESPSVKLILELD
jgi:hypothetical protein